VAGQTHIADLWQLRYLGNNRLNALLEANPDAIPIKQASQGSAAAMLTFLNLKYVQLAFCQLDPTSPSFSEQVSNMFEGRAVPTSQLVLKAWVSTQQQRNAVEEAQTAHLLTRHNCIASLDMMLRLGVEVNVRLHGQCPLHVAAQADLMDMVKLLIRRGAAVDALTDDVKSALQLAQESQSVGTVYLLTAAQEGLLPQLLAEPIQMHDLSISPHLPEAQARREHQSANAALTLQHTPPKFSPPTPRAAKAPASLSSPPSLHQHHVYDTIADATTEATAGIGPGPDLSYFASFACLAVQSRCCSMPSSRKTL
jgi:hypothetical protein